MSPAQLRGVGPIDSHCHLHTLPSDERDAVIDAARQRGVQGFLVPAIELEDAEEILTLCQRHDDMWCALGVHPHSASTWQPGHGKRLAELLKEDRVVAVGECGLDFHYDHSPREDQFRALREQWQIAIDHDLPVIVHNRDSDQEMLEVVREPAFGALRADFHSYCAGTEMARELLDRGFYLGLSGMLTFPRADNVREVIPIAPVEQLLVETDTPYLAPVPYRGKPNRPAYVVEVLQRLAQELKLDAAAAAEQTNANFFRLFQRAAAETTDNSGEARR